VDVRSLVGDGVGWIDGEDNCTHFPLSCQLFF
jgi:hypothetical protein